MVPKKIQKKLMKKESDCTLVARAVRLVGAAPQFAIDDDLHLD